MFPIFDEMNSKNREQVVFSHSYEKRTPRNRMVEKVVIKEVMKSVNYEMCIYPGKIL